MRKNQKQSLRLEQNILWYDATAGADIKRHKHKAKGNSGKQAKVA